MNENASARKPGNVRCYNVQTFQILFNSHLNSMVVFVYHDDSVVCITCNSGRQVKLTVASSFDAKLELESAVREKHLNSVVATISDDDFIVLVDTNTPGPGNIAVFVTVKAECEA